MKVLQVLPELNSGGVERGTVELARHLVTEGHESVVLSNGGRLVSQLEQEGTRHLSLPVHKKSLLSLRYLSRIVRLLKSEQPDILHLRSRAPAWLCYLAWKRLPPNERPRLITTVHGFYSVNFYSAIMTKGEQVICVSNSVKDYVLKNYPKVPPSKLTVIHRGVDADEYQPSFRPDKDWIEVWKTTYPQFEGKQLILLPGRITRWKGHEDFLQIIKDLSHKHPNIHGVIAGAPSPGKEGYLAELKQQVLDLNLNDDITFLGLRSDLREVMATCAITLSLSQDPEAFGRVSLEALALGKPVCAYRHGGVAEQLEALYPQGTIPPCDTGAAVAKISSWLEEPPPEPKLNEEFTLKAMLEKIMAVYTKPS